MGARGAVNIHYFVWKLLSAIHNFSLIHSTVSEYFFQASLEATIIVRVLVAMSVDNVFLQRGATKKKKSNAKPHSL